VLVLPLKGVLLLILLLIMLHVMVLVGGRILLLFTGTSTFIGNVVRRTASVAAGGRRVVHAVVGSWKVDG
jgi:hypothetical protein